MQHEPKRFKPTPLVMSPTKNPKSKTFQYFKNFKLEDLLHLVFEQLSSLIGCRVMVVQSDGKEVTHAGLEGKSTILPTYSISATFAHKSCYTSFLHGVFGNLSCYFIYD